MHVLRSGMLVTEDTSVSVRRGTVACERVPVYFPDGQPKVSEVRACGRGSGRADFQGHRPPHDVFLHDMRLGMDNGAPARPKASEAQARVDRMSAPYKSHVVVIDAGGRVMRNSATAFRRRD
jgi:hypothetical protein